MGQILRILQEGAAQAWQQLAANKLRSFLSLLGVTIGIFCIIGVKSAVDSLEDNIRSSMAKLGNDVIYVEKFSWAEDPGRNWWKWMRRPNNSYAEFEALQERLGSAEMVGYWQFLASKSSNGNHRAWIRLFSWALLNTAGICSTSSSMAMDAIFHL
jgi:putative ABC transport system permease protein